MKIANVLSALALTFCILLVFIPVFLFVMIAACVIFAVSVVFTAPLVFYRHSYAAADFRRVIANAKAKAP